MSRPPTSPRAAQETAASTFEPLAGCRVIEWCGYAAGPYAGKLLAALGADVIKIEPPVEGDPSRLEGPFPGDVFDPEKSALFLYLNNGKRSVTLDPSHPAARELLLRLVTEWADVFLEDRVPSSMEEMGLDYAHLPPAVPGLVMVSVTPFGQTGPYREFLLTPSQVSFAGGAAYSLPDGFHYAADPRPPTAWGRLLPEYSSGMAAAAATLAAIICARRTGQGQHVDVSKQQAQMHPVRQTIDRHRQNSGTVHPRQHAATASLAGTYECLDGYISLWPGREPNMADALAALFGHPEWTADERWHDHEQRVAHAQEFQQRIAGEFRRIAMDHAYHELQAAGMAVSQVYDAEHILRDPQLEARSFLRLVPHEGLGAIPFPVLPFRAAGTTEREPGAAPSLGQHTEDVLGTLLGISAAQQADLREAGAI